MTTFVQSRDAIVTLIHTALQAQHPDLPVFWENTLTVDLDTVANPFLRIEIDFDDAHQLTINDMPEHRTYGHVYFTVFAKEGTGSRNALVLFDSLSDLVKFKSDARFVFGVPTPGRRDARDGWVSYELRAPFFFDSLN